MNMSLKEMGVKLGDSVNLTHMCKGYSTAMVSQVRDGQYVLERPYMHHGDHAYNNGVITYIGKETFTVPETFTGFTFAKKANKID